jgi:hypothetical protein
MSAPIHGEEPAADPGDREQHLRHVIADAGAAAVITTSEPRLYCGFRLGGLPRQGQLDRCCRR